ncbi:MAG TPA: radical SAM protein, partial [Acidimicrobiales bacterium]|nr:radical SAM protein [Acidimicrobiales bacterium]
MTVTPVTLGKKPAGFRRSDATLEAPPASSAGQVETVRYLDTPVELEVDGRRCQYAPMRMEWSFDPDRSPLDEQELVFELGPEEPAVLQIHVTEGCNLRCSYCSHFLNPKKGAGTLAEPEIEMLLEEVRAMPAHGVVILHGGEPLTVPDIVFRFVEASPVTVVIYTNGTLLTDDVLSRLRGTKAVLLLSADGDPEATGEARFGPKERAVTDQIFAALDRLKNSGVPFGIAMVMADHNIDTIEDHVRYLMERYNPDSFGVNPKHYLAKAPMEDLQVGPITDAFVRLLRFSIETGVYIDQIARRLTPIIRGKSLIKDCSACGTKRVYHPGGRWMNCTNNVEPDTSIDAWSRYLPVLTPSCHGCIGIGVCGGGCIADAKALNPGGFDDRFCESTRALVRSVLEYCSSRPELASTNRQALAAHLGHLLQRGKRDAAGGGGELRR